MRCGTRGASGHVTAKPSIRNGRVLYKSAAYAPKVIGLTPGDLPGRPSWGGLGYGRPVKQMWLPLLVEGGSLHVSEKAVRRFKERIRALTQRTRGRSLRQIVAELRTYLLGWRNYFALATGRRRPPIPIRPAEK